MYVGGFVDVEMLKPEPLCWTNSIKGLTLQQYPDDTQNEITKYVSYLMKY